MAWNGPYPLGGNKPGPPGTQGEDGEDAILMPGAPGPQGNPGATGSQGDQGFPGTPGEDGESAILMPGVPGPQGNPGATGPSYPVVISLVGEDGEQGFPIPGAQGQQGVTGATGPSYPLLIQYECGQDETLATGSGGGSGSLVLGNSVTGGSANAILYESSTQTLAASSKFTFDGNAQTIEIDGNGTTLTKALTITNTTAATSLVNQNSPALVLTGSGWSTYYGAAETLSAAIVQAPTAISGINYAVGKLSFQFYGGVLGSTWTEAASLDDTGTFSLPGLSGSVSVPVVTSPGGSYTTLNLGSGPSNTAINIGSSYTTTISLGSIAGCTTTLTGAGVGFASQYCARITPTSKTPIWTTDGGTSITAVYVTPYEGDVFTTPDGTVTFSEVTFKLTDTQTGTTSSTAATVTGLTDTSHFCVGMKASGAGVYSGATISTIDSKTQVTLSHTGTASGSGSITFQYPDLSVVDLFAVLVGGALVVYPGTLWTNTTTRYDAVAITNGVYINTTAVRSGQYNTIAANKGVLIGSVYIVGGDGETSDTTTNTNSTNAVVGISNALNPVDRPFRLKSFTSSWTYASTTVRPWNAGSEYATLYVLNSIPTLAQSCNVIGMTSNPTSQAGMVAAGVDSSSSFPTSTIFSRCGGGVGLAPSVASWAGFAGVGLHSLTLVEFCYANGTSVTFQGAAVKDQSGATGTFQG